MVWLFIIGAVIVLFASGLTGELIQTQVLHNTTPIAQRGAMSDFIIGAIFWIVIGAVVFAVRRRIAVNENLRARRDADIAAEQQRERDRQDQIKQHDKAQREVGEMLQTKNRYAVDQFEKLPLYVSNAHQYLDIAEQEFKETAYVPFWTAIENATNELGRFIDGISVINRTASEYHSLAES
jgi:flagellar biosynthesis/type III secretory pathway M-ring protein FliF/YscJ